MTLPIQSFNQMVAQQQAAMNSVSNTPLDFTPGSVLNALIEANAGLGLWLQAIASALYAASRLSTSTGNDVDTFVQDFGFMRYAGAASSGAVTFSRTSTVLTAYIPVGTLLSVSSLPGLNFIVSVPPSGASYPAYNPSTMQYVINSGTSSANAFVVCQQNGTIGNVNIGQIDTIFSSILGLGTVSNAAAFVNGAAPWTDAQTKTEFVQYIQSQSRATMAAISYAVSIVPGVVRFALLENINSMGNSQVGIFTVVADSGGGNLSMTVKDAIQNSVELYRGFTIQFGVIAPTAVTANITMNIILVANPTETQSQITANITAAITNYINTQLGFAPILYITKLIQLTYDADPNILEVDTMKINSSTSNLDESGTFNAVIITGTVTPTY